MLYSGLYHVVVPEHLFGLFREGRGGYVVILGFGAEKSVTDTSADQVGFVACAVQQIYCFSYVVRNMHQSLNAPVRCILF